MPKYTYAAGVAINYYQPSGYGKLTSISDGHGWLSGAICRACLSTSVYVVEAWRTRTNLSLAGVQTKMGAEPAVRLICRNPACDIQPSPPINERHHRSHT